MSDREVLIFDVPYKDPIGDCTHVSASVEHIDNLVGCYVLIVKPYIKLASGSSIRPMSRETRLSISWGEFDRDRLVQLACRSDVINMAHKIAEFGVKLDETEGT